MHASRANTSTDAPLANPAPRPLPLPSTPPQKAHTRPVRTARSPATRNPPPHPRARKRPPRTTGWVYPPPPTAGNSRRPATQSPTPQGTPAPPSGPQTPIAHSSVTLGPPPPAPECSLRELFPPVITDAQALVHCRSPAQPSPLNGDCKPRPPLHAAAGHIAPQTGGSRRAPGSRPPPIPSPRRWPPLTRSRGGPGHGTLRWTRTGEQAGKALRSQGHHYARVM